MWRSFLCGTRFRKSLPQPTSCKYIYVHMGGIYLWVPYILVLLRYLIIIDQNYMLCPQDYEVVESYLVRFAVSNKQTPITVC